MNDNGHNSICSVSQMAKLLGLSRTRFYQLSERGVFPPPVYSITSKRPFHTHDLRNQCLQIRKTGIGHNGRPVIFNNKVKSKAKILQKEKPRQDYSRFLELLAQVGRKTSAKQVQMALETLYPDNTIQQFSDEKILRDLDQHFKKKL